MRASHMITRRSPGKRSIPWDMTLFVDDVKLKAKSGDTLQRLLNEAGNWAAAYGTV